MFTAPNPLVLCFVRRSGQTSASEYVGVSAPPNEAGGGEGLRAINMLPLRGNALLPISEPSYRVSSETQSSQRFAENIEIKTQLCKRPASCPKLETVHPTITPIRGLCIALTRACS